MSLAHPLDALRLAWQRLSPYDAASPKAASFRARQIHAVLRLTPLMVAANAVNVLLVAAAFWGVHSLRAMLVGWGVVVMALVARTAVSGWRARHHPPRATASLRSMRRAVVHATVLALLWSLPPLLLFPGADGPRQLVVATVTTGMMCAGGFALATVPAAGTAYVAILGFSAAGALVAARFPLAWPLGGLLMVYMLIVLASVWSTARLFGARMVAEAEAERQNEVIGLLLRDFEENASDVLWEIDALGHLRHASPRLLSLLEMPPEEAARHSVLKLLLRWVPDDAASAAQLAAIKTHLERGQPFRDLPLATTRDGRTRWWSLSAKPLLDAHGKPAGWRGVASDVTATHRANRQLTWLAHFDALTGLANRHQFRALLADLLQPSFGEPRPFALLCLDLDHFKTINDTLGHAVGDALLQEFARRLLSRTRRSDTVARLGGDEFAIILREVAGTEEAEVLVARLLEGLQSPCEVQGTRIQVRTSIGVAMAPRDGAEIDVLLNQADLALYAAKSAGRGAFRFFAPDMAALTRRRLVIEQELRGAIERRELSLAFQPQVDTAAWRVTGFEALLRWRHPELGDVSPAEFIPVAEESGLVAAIGEWVLRQACREAARWPGGLTVAVNVSPAQAMSHDLARIALTALKECGLVPSQLELEITESTFLDETQATQSTLHGLREAGLRIALDDFGIGYSSLAYLRRFPFDTLKIDRSFVRELMQRRDARAIVRMIVGLARTLNMKTVAEGVEEPAQAAALGEYGCQALQGYLIARPMRSDEVLPFLQQWGERPRLALPEFQPTTTLPL